MILTFMFLIFLKFSFSYTFIHSSTSSRSNHLDYVLRAVSAPYSPHFFPVYSMPRSTGYPDSTQLFPSLIDFFVTVQSSVDTLTHHWIQCPLDSFLYLRPCRGGIPCRLEMQFPFLVCYSRTRGRHRGCYCLAPRCHHNSVGRCFDARLAEQTSQHRNPSTPVLRDGQLPEEHISSQAKPHRHEKTPSGNERPI